jgi:hypothetical protein
MFAIRGWLLLLALLLAVWEPFALALVLSSMVGRLADRPVAAALVALRLVATALGLAAGIGLLTRRPHSVRLAKAALLLFVVTGLLVHVIPGFPRNHPASFSVVLASLTLAYNLAWLVYLSRSIEAREIEEGDELQS